MACYELAMQRSETVAIAEEDIIQARARYTQTLGDVLPKISLRASEFLQQRATTSGDSGVGSTFTRVSRPEVAVTLTQPLFQGLQEMHAIRASHADESRQRYLKAEAERKLFLDVGSAYFLVVQVEFDMRTTQAMFRVSRERVAELRERVNLGKSRTGELAAQEADAALLAADLEKKRGDRATVYEVLAFLTGAEPQPAIALVDPWGRPAESLDVYLGRTNDRPDVLAAQEAAKAGQEEVRTRKGKFLPRVDLQANYYPYRVGFQKDIHWDAQLGLNVPVFQWGTVGEVRQAKSRARQAELHAEERSRAAATDIKKAFAAYQASVREWRQYETAVRKAKESYDLQVGDFRLGLIANLDLLKAQTTWLDAMRRRDAARVETWLNRTALELMAGRSPS